MCNVKLFYSETLAVGFIAQTHTHTHAHTHREQKVGLRTMKCVINSQKLIDWWQAEKDIQNRQGGVDLGQEFFATGFLRHGMLNVH